MFTGKKTKAKTKTASLAIQTLEDDGNVRGMDL